MIAHDAARHLSPAVHPDFGFDDAAALAPYLARLGVSHLYASPYLKARPGSTHGYDIVDHNALNPELGDEAAFARMIAALRSARAWADPRFRAEPHGRRRRRQSVLARRARMGPGLATTPAGSTSTGTPTGATCTTSCWCRSWATSTASSWRPASSRCSSMREAGSFAVWAYDTHKLPICPLHYARILGDDASGARAARRRVRRPAATGARRSRGAPTS